MFYFKRIIIDFKKQDKPETNIYLNVKISPKDFVEIGNI